MALVVQTPPAAEPVSTANMKTHLRVDHFDEDDFIGGLIKAARRHIESIQNRSLIDTTWDLYLDEWPSGDEIVLPRAPLSSVTSIVHIDDDDTETTFAASNYIVDTFSVPGRVVLKNGNQWPSGDLRSVNGIRFRFVAGYGTAASDVPEDSVHLIKLMVSHWYEHREPELVGTTTKQLPHALDALLWQDRLVLRA